MPARARAVPFWRNGFLVAPFTSARSNWGTGALARAILPGGDDDLVDGSFVESRANTVSGASTLAVAWPVRSGSGFPSAPFGRPSRTDARSRQPFLGPGTHRDQQQLAGFVDAHDVGFCTVHLVTVAEVAMASSCPGTRGPDPAIGRARHVVRTALPCATALQNPSCGVHRP